MTDWKAFLIILAVFVIAFMISKIVSVSSISAAVALVVTGVLFAAFGVPSDSIFFGATPYTWYKAGLAVVFLHRTNIKRLFNGEEKKFTYKKRAEVKEELKKGDENTADSSGN